MELCDLISQNRKLFSDKLAWICGRCPQPELLSSASPRISRSHLHAVVALARFLSRRTEESVSAPGGDGSHKAESVAVEFFRAIPSSFHRSFWPQGFSNESISSFYVEFLGYLAKACVVSADLADEISGLIGDVVLIAYKGNCDGAGVDMEIVRVFLVALAKDFPPISLADADKIVTGLLDQLSIPVPPRDQMISGSETTSSHGSPLSGNNLHPSQANGSPGNEGASSASSKGSSAMINGGSGQHDEDSVESLEKHDIIFKLIGHVLDHSQIDSKLLEQVRAIVRKQLQFMSAFLKVCGR